MARDLAKTAPAEYGDTPARVVLATRIADNNDVADAKRVSPNPRTYEACHCRGKSRRNARRNR